MQEPVNGVCSSFDLSLRMGNRRELMKPDELRKLHSTICMLMSQIDVTSSKNLHLALKGSETLQHSPMRLSNMESK